MQSQHGHAVNVSRKMISGHGGRYEARQKKPFSLWAGLHCSTYRQRDGKSEKDGEIIQQSLSQFALCVCV